MRNSLHKCAFSLPALMLLATSAANADSNLTAWTQHGDNLRSGANLSETTLTPANVNQTNFGKLFTQAVTGDIYSQPLYVRDLTVAGAPHNVVFVSTAANNIYAFDADANVAAYWSANLGNPIPQADVQCCCTDISTVVGVISTGVIDPSTNTWYLVTQTKRTSDSTYHQFLNAIDITTGAQKFSGPVEITATSGGVTFDPKLNNQRTALLLQNGSVYIAWSSHNDCGDYHGWVMKYNAATIAQQGAWASSTASGARTGIWMAGSGLIGDGQNVYFSTGNGTFDLNTGGTNHGESYIKLSGALARLDYFTPASQAALNSADRDLGGGGAMMIPGTRRVVGGGKDGKFYLVNMDAMGGYNASTDACVQSFMVTDTTDGLNHIHGGPSFFNGTAFVGGESDELKGFAWNGTTFGTTPSTTTTFEGVSASMPGWQHMVSADGAKNGIVWTTRVFSGNANNATQPGIMHAFSAANLGTELWNSKQNAARDDFGNFAKNPAPLVVNGKVYCPTFSNQLAVYGLLNGSSSGGPGIMASWTLNETTGTAVSDGSGNGNTGAVTGTATWVAGKNAGAFSFNGATSIANGNSQSLNPTAAISVSAWFNTAMAATATTSVIRHDGNFTALQITGVGNGQTALWNNGVLTTVPFTWSYGNSAWHHFVATYDMTAGEKTYIDGTLVASNTALRGPLSTATAPFMLGAKEDGTEKYTGLLDDVTVWNRALTATEVTSLASGGFRGEGEQLTVVQTSGDVERVMDDPAESAGHGAILDANAATDFVTFALPNVTQRSYNVKVGVKKGANRATVQVALARLDNLTFTNLSTPIDMYSATNAYTVFDLGTWTPGTTSDKAIKFTVTGKNAASTGFEVPIDYVILTGM